MTMYFWVISVKGGTGKTLVAVNTSLVISRKWFTALFDGDWDSPNVGKILGIEDTIVVDGSRHFVPFQYKPKLKVLSSSLYTGGEIARTMHGDQTSRFITDALKYTKWGKLDFMVIDMPAGSGDELRTVIGTLGKIDGAIVVTLPTTLSDFVRVIDVCSNNSVRILGVVGNMTGSRTTCCRVGAVCSKCQEPFNPFGPDDGIKAICDDNGLEYMGGIPLDEKIRINLESGKPVLPRGDIDVIKRIVKKMVSWRVE